MTLPLVPLTVNRFHVARDKREDWLVSLVYLLLSFVWLNQTDQIDQMNRETLESRFSRQSRASRS